MKGRTAKAALCAALGNIIWGFSFLFTKMGLTVAPNPNVMLAHRFILSALFMGIPLLLGKQKISFKGKNWKPVALLLLLQSCYFLLETYGILYTNATISGMVLAVVPVVTIGTGALFLREYPTRRQALFCILPVAGVIIMTVSGKELGVVTPLGILFLLLTMLASVGITFLALLPCAWVKAVVVRTRAFISPPLDLQIISRTGLNSHKLAKTIFSAKPECLPKVSNISAAGLVMCILKGC